MATGNLDNTYKSWNSATGKNSLLPLFSYTRKSGWIRYLSTWPPTWWTRLEDVLNICALCLTMITPSFMLRSLIPSLHHYSIIRAWEIKSFTRTNTLYISILAKKDQGSEKKRSTGPQLALTFLGSLKKRPVKGLNSLSCLQALEKKKDPLGSYSLCCQLVLKRVHWTWKKTPVRKFFSLLSSFTASKLYASTFDSCCY